MRCYKTFLASAITLFLLACSSHPKKSEKPVIEVDRSYLDKFELCEKIARWFETDEEMYEIMEKSSADSAILAWNQLKDICNQNKLYEAKDLLTDKRFEGHLIIFLRNTTAQYVYFNGIKYPILAQVDSTLARKEILNDLEFCLTLTELVIETKSPEKTSLPPHYESLIYDYFMLLLEEGDYGKARTLPDKLYRYNILDGLNESKAAYHRLILETKLSVFEGPRKAALKKINELYTFMKSDPELEEDADSKRMSFLNMILSE